MSHLLILEEIWVQKYNSPLTYQVSLIALRITKYSLSFQAPSPLSFAGNAAHQSHLCQNACNMFSTLMIVFNQPPYYGLGQLVCALII